MADEVDIQQYIRDVGVLAENEYVVCNGAGCMVVNFEDVTKLPKAVHSKNFRTNKVSYLCYQDMLLSKAFALEKNLSFRV
jgi:hypothetical protein